MPSVALVPVLRRRQNQKAGIDRGMSMRLYFMESGWFYLVNDNRIGPVDRSEIDLLISQNAVVWQTLVWRAGMDGWEKAGHHFTFSGGVGGPPPVPPRAPTAGVAMRASATTLRG